jgi:hypothetical protein
MKPDSFLVSGFVFHSPWIHTMLRCVLHQPSALLVSLQTRWLPTWLAALLLMPMAVLAERSPEHRVFPAQALRGELVITTASDALLNGQAARLAPGARIRGENNQLLMSAGLIGQTLTVHYTREPVSDLLMDIWVLRPVERANRLWPTRAAEAKLWAFDPAAQTWKKP